MAREHAVIFRENLPVPLNAFTFEGFQSWLESGEFPDTGRVDFLAGEVETEMSPEDLYTHSVVKAAIASTLHVLIAEQDRGEVYIDSTRIVSPVAGLSVEPDVVVALWESFESGRVRLVPASHKGPNRFLAVEGALDVIVEIVSDSSQKKDTERLPRLYARAGISELWLADARDREIRFTIHTLQKGGYVAAEQDTDGWAVSPRLGSSFRLLRRPTRLGHLRYVLEHRA
jgi:Uma2 family endonuclease